MLIPLLLPLALQSAAVSPVPAEPSEIVVQGTRVGKEQIRDFVKAVTKVPFDGQLGRLDAAACPSSMGLTPAQNAIVAERMRKVASAAGIRLAPAPCTPNVFVVVTRDKRAAIDAINRQFPGYFGDMSSKEVENLATSPAPAVAWQVRSMLSADGERLEKSVGSTTYQIQGTYNPSRIRAVTKPTFVASIVVVDVKAAAGLTTTELADYAVMRTFAATDPDRVVKTGVPTILGVLGQPDDKPLPVTLTYWDLGLLKALYSTDNAYYARYQRGEIEQVVKEELERSGKGEEPR